MSATASRRSLTVIWRGFCKFVVRSSGAVLARLDAWGLVCGGLLTRLDVRGLFVRARTRGWNIWPVTNLPAPIGWRTSG